jgi:hypothetical protein
VCLCVCVCVCVYLSVYVRVRLCLQNEDVAALIQQKREVTVERDQLLGQIVELRGRISDIDTKFKLVRTSVCLFLSFSLCLFVCACACVCMYVSVRLLGCGAASRTLTPSSGWCARLRVRVCVVCVCVCVCVCLCVCVSVCQIDELRGRISVIGTRFKLVRTSVNLSVRLSSSLPLRLSASLPLRQVSAHLALICLHPSVVFCVDTSTSRQRTTEGAASTEEGRDGEGSEEEGGTRQAAIGKIDRKRERESE